MTKAKKVMGEAAVVETVATVEATYKPLDRKVLLTSTKAIEAAIAEAKIAGDKAQNLYQTAACSALQHLYVHKDIRVIRNLLNTMSEGMRKKAMATFIDKFGQVTFDDKGEVHYNGERKLDLNGALNMAWWKAAAESVYVPYILEAKIKKILDDAKNKLAKGLKEGDHVTTSLIAALEKTLADFAPATPTEAQLEASQQIAA